MHVSEVNLMRWYYKTENLIAHEGKKVIGSKQVQQQTGKMAKLQTLGWCGLKKLKLPLKCYQNLKTKQQR